jgi:flagellar basal-body rod protein FlgG
MMRALMISASGMTAQQLAMDTIANNLANVNTTAFKTSQAKFADILYQQTGETTSATAGDPLSVGLGVQNTQIQKQFTSGTLQATNNPLDLALQGEGFFQVLQPDGSVAYTRDGSFKVSSEGVLCTANGNPISPQVQIPTDALQVKIGADGVVAVQKQGDTVAQPIAQLELARFVNSNGLQSIGQNMYSTSEASGEPIVNTPGNDGLATIAQGNLEMSNVNLVQEMVNMIFTQRAYEVNTKSIQASDEMLKMANNLKGA